jgi:TM2 domain-containing membrane protein YozV
MMKKSIYAAMLSGIICPGSGQLWLGKKLQGWGFISVSVVCIMVLMDQMISRAQVIAEQILAGNIGNDLASIYAAVSEVALDTSSSSMSALTWVFLANWGLSIISAFWFGAQQDKQLQRQTDTKTAE